LMPSHSSTSSNITGVCAALTSIAPQLFFPAQFRVSLLRYFFTSLNP
jgi:hypothetical protein